MKAGQVLPGDEVGWGVAQIMYVYIYIYTYIYVSKCKNNKIKIKHGIHTL
jgi:hypothetical protein